jgi:diguanylate cyclase (GGDEF)-like protein/PAS domain S-box-containing protein
MESVEAYWAMEAASGLGEAPGQRPRAVPHGALLIVDDNEIIRELLGQYLESAGYTITVAAGGRQALALVNQRAFDLVLLDVMMPGIDGLTVLQNLRTTYDPTELPVIMLTGCDESKSIVHALDLGANDYVTKPFDFAVVRARIRTQVSLKRAKAALRESEERYALAVRGANDGLWDWNLLTQAIYFSPRWQAMLGYKEQEMAPTLDAWLTRVHPEDRQPLEAALMAHLKGYTPHFEHEYRILHEDDTYRWMLSRGLAVRNASGHATRIAGSQTDITERKVADVLTGLPNRVLFTDRLARAIERTQRRPDYLFAVLLLDLDQFKTINESLGHSVGDQLLIALAHRLHTYLRAADLIARAGEGPTVARLGGDEFVILLGDLKDVNDATRVAEQIQQQFAAPFLLPDHEVFVSASIGIALSTTGYNRPEELLRDADIARSRAKAQGKARHVVFDTAMHDRAMAHLHIEMDLRRAIERQEFCVFYQPIVALASGSVSGFEALVRWQHPQRGLLLPTEFIAIAEENTPIVAIGWSVLWTACQQMAAWQRQFSAQLPLTISVNVSGKQCAQADLVPGIAQILHETSLAAHHVKLEITESVLMEHMTGAVLEQLQLLGIQLSIDDFGTGYSSLSYLCRFPMKMLKIDRSFISRITLGGHHTEVVRAIIALAHTLDMQVTAEGVETAEQLAVLRALHCDYGQGHFFSPPLDTAATTRLLMAAPRW